eukprot:jgi/Antlo1/1963/135
MEEMCDVNLDKFLNYLDTILFAENKVHNVSQKSLSTKMTCQNARDIGKGDVFVLVSKYQKQCKRSATQKIMHKMEVSEKMNLYHMCPQKLAKALTNLDLGLYRGICSIELVTYKGPKDDGGKCRTLLRLKSKNESLTSFVCEELNTFGNFRYFYKLASKLQKLRNYNSYDAVVSGMRTFPMNRTQHQKLTDLMKRDGRGSDIYDIMRMHMMTKTFFVPPSGYMLRDIQESNLHSESELASMKFCKAVELLVYVQNLEPEFRVQSKYEHFVIHRLNQCRKQRIETYEIESTKEYAYFLLWEC